MRVFAIFYLITVQLALPILAQEVDIPEDVARLETIDHARSPLDNTRLTLGEYAKVQEDIQKPLPTEASIQLKQLILLLRVRKLIKSVVPFAPL
jgi:hypothetical protein